MTDPHDKARNSEAPTLSDSVFMDIRPEELPQYLNEARTVVMERLREHLKETDDASEWQSLAFSIGTLSELARIVSRWLDRS